MMASSPLGLMRLKESPPTPLPGSRTTSLAPAGGAWTRAADAAGAGGISGSGSLADGAREAAQEEIVLAAWGCVGVEGLLRPRLASASRVPSGSTITLITRQQNQQ